MGHDHLLEMLNRLKLTAIRDQVDSLIDEAARRELSIREALSLFCEREIARNTVISGSLLMSFGRNLPTFVDQNLPASVTGCPLPGTAPRPCTTYAARRSAGSSSGRVSTS